MVDVYVVEKADWTKLALIGSASRGAFRRGVGVAAFCVVGACVTANATPTATSAPPTATGIFHDVPPPGGLVGIAPGGTIAGPGGAGAGMPCIGMYRGTSAMSPPRGPPPTGGGGGCVPSPRMNESVTGTPVDVGCAVSQPVAIPPSPMTPLMLSCGPATLTPVMPATAWSPFRPLFPAPQRQTRNSITPAAQNRPRSRPSSPR